MLYSQMVGSTSAAVLQKLLATFKWQEQSHGEMCTSAAGVTPVTLNQILSNLADACCFLLSENGALPLSKSRTAMYGIRTEIVQ